MNTEKKRYNIQIAGIQFTVLSDEPEDFVLSTVDMLDRRVSDLFVHNKRCSKLDAAILCALDEMSERRKAEKKIRNLETQISLYEARMKKAGEKDGSASPAPEAGAAEVQQLHVSASEQQPPVPQHNDKLREIESLLRRRG